MKPDDLTFSFFCNRINEQFDYMFSILTSDRTKERKQELLQSANDCLENLLKQTPPPLAVPVLLMAIQGAGKYAVRCQGLIKPKDPRAGVDTIPRNDGTQCVCNHYPGRCWYCFDKNQ